jgi:hypothetical protein
VPKPLFYLGVFSTMLIALLSAVYAVSAWAWPGGESADGLALSGRPGAPLFFLAVLLFSIPAGALFVRIASLLAVRSLFDAFLAIAALVSTLITVALLTISSLRLAVLAGSLRTPEAQAMSGTLLESHLVSYYALGLFLSLLLISLRPWFRIQASAILSGSMLLPGLLYAWILVEEHFIAPVATMSAAFRSAPSFAFFIIVAGIFAGLAVHCLLHRHLFVEVTNLREIIEPPVDQRLRPAALDPRHPRPAV